MKGVLILLGALFLIILLPLGFGALHDARVSSLEQSFSEIATGIGETTANVTLSDDVWKDAITSITLVSSNETYDAPSASGYNSSTEALTIGGLASSANRTLTVVFEIANPDLADLTSVDAFVNVIAVFLILSILGLIAGAIYSFFK